MPGKRNITVVRRERLMKFLAEMGSVSVTQLAKLLRTKEETLAKDRKHLRDAGYIAESRAGKHTMVTLANRARMVPLRMRTSRVERDEPAMVRAWVAWEGCEMRNARIAVELSAPHSVWDMGFYPESKVIDRVTLSGEYPIWSWVAPPKEDKDNPFLD